MSFSLCSCKATLSEITVLRLWFHNDFSPIWKKKHQKKEQKPSGNKHNIKREEGKVEQAHERHNHNGGGTQTAVCGFMNEPSTGTVLDYTWPLNEWCRAGLYLNYSGPANSESSPSTASPICDNNTDFKVSWGCTWSSPSTNQTDCFMCKKKLTCSPGYRRTDRVEGLLTSTLWGPEFFYSFRLTLNFHFYHASLVKTALMYCTYLASFIISFTAFSEVPTLLINRYASVSLISTRNLFFLNHP